MRAQHFAQGRMEQVGRRMVEDGAGTASGVDRGNHMVADLQTALGDTTDVTMELARELERVGDIEFDAPPGQHAGVTALAAGFGVDRRAIEDPYRIVTRPDGCYRTTVLQQRDNLQATGIQLVVAK